MKSDNVDPPPPKKSKSRAYLGHLEDPYIFMEDDHHIWPEIKKFYGLDESLNSTNFLRRTEEGKIKNLYLTNDGVRNFVINNKSSLKVHDISISIISILMKNYKKTDCNLTFNNRLSISVLRH
jgi:hypothetical protein